LFGRRLGHVLLLWWVGNVDEVRERLLGAGLAFGIRTLHDLNLYTEHTLPEHDVPDGMVDEINGRLTGVDHETVGELHGLGTGGTKLSGDDDFAALGTGLHDETEDTVASPADSKAVEEFVLQTLTLGNSGETAVLNLLGVDLERALGEAGAETLFNERGKLTDPTALLAQDFLGVGSTDDNLSTSGGGHSDIAARVSLLGEFTGKEIIEFSAENTIGDEFSPLATLCRHLGEGWRYGC